VTFTVAESAKRRCPFVAQTPGVGGMEESGSKAPRGHRFAGTSSTPRHTPPHAFRALAQSRGLEVPSSNLGAPIGKTIRGYSSGPDRLRIRADGGGLGQRTSRATRPAFRERKRVSTAENGSRSSPSVATRTTDGLSSWCAACHVEANRRWRAENPGKVEAFNPARRVVPS
jgi:hypothetical protein